MYPRKGDAMNLPRAGTGFMPYIPKQYMLSVHTAVLEGIAVFFHSTYSLPIPISPPICTTFFKTSAPALRRVRFFVVGKSLLLTFYQPRAPPSSLEFSVFKNFRTGGNLNIIPLGSHQFPASEPPGNGIFHLQSHHNILWQHTYLISL